ncbi:MutS domain III [Clostridium acidisoli DSM 12555]|uniref:MutS domain III n=1 Tax=Clostridium acidisoli DSM 12555 TaxID=1121291 RepID=A0A1W1XRV9_9CLOT|nr:DNA mismatch repair protein MutS [Clostridium acidisoli]SMC26248.1 MutS domain III [Clostridium acidisoli DSM 12555]
MGEQGVDFIMNIFFIFLIFIAVILINFSINTSYVYLIGFIPLVLILFLGFYIRKKTILDGLNKTFKKEWGKSLDRKRNFNNIRSLFDYISGENSNEFHIDDQTWSDLTMNEIYTKIDRTITSIGEEMLYNLLRTPLFNKDKLEKRNKFINLLGKNEEFRNSIGTNLLKLGRVKKNYLSDLLWNDINVDTKYKSICMLLGVLPIALGGVAFLTKNVYFVLLIFVVLFMNFKFHGKIKKEIYQYVSCIGYLNSMVATSLEISKIKNIDGFEKYKTMLGEVGKKTEAISKKSTGLGRVEGMDQTGILDILYIVFLIEENQFFSCIGLIKKYQEDLKKLYICIGEIDALLSVASYREGLDNYVYPEFTAENKYFEANDMIHPLLKKPVGNSIVMKERGIILTGSNMSGKSTFLRTVGVNIVLAQTIYMTTSRFYRASFFKIMTSISPEDNIMGGKSYYFREAEALLRIIHEGGEDYPLLCIIDEIFRGTNPVERINASIEILNYLERHNAMPIVATHDLEITDILKDSYNLFYFTEDIDKEGMVFDYKLKNGVCRTRNAVKLLKYLNYPEEIVNNTNKRIENNM